jgi:signal transduction histidine kinase
MVLGARVRSLLKLKAATDALEDSYRKLRELEKVRDDLMKMIVHDSQDAADVHHRDARDAGGRRSRRGHRSQQGALRDTENKAQELLHSSRTSSRLRASRRTSISLDLEPLDPSRSVHEIMNDWTLRLQQERASTTIEVAADVPPFPRRRSLLKRVFGNLIQNSLIHSSTAVELRIFARTDPRGVLFTVADNGPGIPPQYHEVIFTSSSA